MISFIVELNNTCEYEAKINSEIKKSELIVKNISYNICKVLTTL